MLASNELIVPLRAVDGAALGTLVLGDPADGAAPTADRVRTVELFAQQVASIIENARLYEESERERGRGEAISDIARAVSGSLRLDDVMTLGLGHAIALLHAQGAALSLVRDQQLTSSPEWARARCWSARRCRSTQLERAGDRERRPLICNDSERAPRVLADAHRREHRAHADRSTASRAAARSARCR